MERMVSPACGLSVAGRALRLLYTSFEPLFVRGETGPLFLPCKSGTARTQDARWVYVLSLVSLLLPDAQECPTGASRPERRTVDSFAAKIRARAARIFGALGARDDLHEPTQEEGRVA